MKINLTEDDNNVIQGEPADATVNLKLELATQIRDIFSMWSSNKKFDELLNEFIEPYQIPGMTLEPFYNVTVNDTDNGAYVLHVTSNIRLYHEVSPKPTQAEILVIPKEIFIGMVELFQKTIIKLIPEVYNYSRDVLTGIIIKVYDTDVYLKETYKGAQYSTGITTIKEFNKDVDTTFLKEMPLDDFLICNISDIFTLKHDIILSQEYREKRNGLVRKTRALFKHYHKGTFQGVDYELEDYTFHIFDNSDKFKNLKDEEVPILQPVHIKIEMEFRGTITVNGNKYRLYDLKNNTTEDSPQEIKDANNFAIELNKYISDIGKGLSIPMGIFAYN